MYNAPDIKTLLKNMSLKVKFKGNGVGKVKSQSITSRKPLLKNTVIELVVI
jgi:hypothetical protein